MKRRSFIKGAISSVGIAALSIGMLVRHKPSVITENEFNRILEQIWEESSSGSHYCFVGLPSRVGGLGDWIKDKS